MGLPLGSAPSWGADLKHRERIKRSKTVWAEARGCGVQSLGGQDKNLLLYSRRGVSSPTSVWKPAPWLQREGEQIGGVGGQLPWHLWGESGLEGWGHLASLCTSSPRAFPDLWLQPPGALQE